MPGHGVPDPPGDLKYRNNKGKRWQLVIIIAVICLLAIPAAAYYIYYQGIPGRASEVKVAIDNEQSAVKLAAKDESGNRIDQILQHGDLVLTIEQAVWEDDELVLAYSINDPGLGLGDYCLVYENSNQITLPYYSEGGRIIKFINMDTEAMKSGQVWLRILSLTKQELDPSFLSDHWISITPEMKQGEAVAINQELEAERGIYLLTQIHLGSDHTKISFEFTPQDKFRQFYASEYGHSFVPRLGLNVAGKKYRQYFVEGSMLTEDGPYVGTFYFEPVPIEKVNEFQIGVLDSHLIVDWKLPINGQHQESARWALGEEIELPEGKLILSWIRHGALSTAINFTFEPAPGFEDISRLSFDAYLRSGGKYYIYHGPDGDGFFDEFSGTVIFNHVQSDDVKALEQYGDAKELEFILGKIVYTYDTGAGATVSQDSIPQTIEARGSRFTIDRMEYQDGNTLLHIAYDQENRWFYNAHFGVELPPVVNGYSIGWISEMGSVELENGEELEQGFRRLKNNLGDYGGEVLNDDLRRNVIGVNLRISGEYEEIDIKLESLSAIRYSGEKVRIHLK